VTESGSFAAISNNTETKHVWVSILLPTCSTMKALVATKNMTPNNISTKKANYLLQNGTTRQHGSNVRGRN
jgi:hypothetical protein